MAWSISLHVICIAALAVTSSDASLVRVIDEPVDPSGTQVAVSLQEESPTPTPTNLIKQVTNDSSKSASKLSKTSGTETKSHARQQGLASERGAEGLDDPIPTVPSADKPGGGDAEQSVAEPAERVRQELPDFFAGTALPARRGVVAVDVKATRDAGVSPAAAKLVDSSFYHEYFLAGSRFVPSEDFDRIATVFFGSLRRPTFFIAKLRLGRFTDPRFTEQRLNGGRTDSRWYDFERVDKSLEAANWRFGIAPDFCLVRPRQSDYIIIGSQYHFPFIARALGPGLGDALSQLTSVVRVRADRSGLLVLQARMIGLSLFKLESCGVSAESLMVSSVGEHGSLLDGWWKPAPGQALSRVTTCVDTRFKVGQMFSSFGDLLDGLRVKEDSGRVIMESNLGASETNTLLSVLRELVGAEQEVKPARKLRPNDECALGIATTHAAVPAAAVQNTRMLSLSEFWGDVRYEPDRSADGKFLGIRVYEIRPNSRAAARGLMDGDRVEQVNGVVIAAPFVSVAEAEQYTIRVHRDGATVELSSSRLVDTGTASTMESLEHN